MASDTETNEYGLEVAPWAPHLGGFIAKGDPCSHVPTLWRHLVEEEGVRSVLDVGCGAGHALDSFKELGLTDVLGVDGVDTGRTDVAVWDYTERPFMPTRVTMVQAPGGREFVPRSVRREYDLCWSCEFVEHVEERFAPGFLVSFAACKLVLLTHATPGQGGYHHVNERDEAYWIGFMAAGNYVLDETLTGYGRALAKRDHANAYFARTGLAFRRYRDVS